MRRRTKGRECALQVLYQADITGHDFRECLADFWATRGRFEPSVKDFAETLVARTAENLEKIDSVITGYAANWEIKRMATVDRNILRMAACEILFMEDIPDKVSINEAIELAKKYGDKDSGKFVNGILDKISKDAKKYVTKS